ncbi:hypothetical protein C7T35_09215 [Variovorax sp. WS11]|nr:hypothetical protein [Variovorax sp. WS11]PSL85053.1 hypothetical protein C7T35_09215 [Variovorax sp. WS11]
MSDAPVLRRADKLMDDARIEEMLSSTYSGRLGTIGADGWPYVCPLLFVMLGGEVWVHNTGATGHLRRNVLQHGKVCFELDVPGKVFPYGRLEPAPVV